MALAGGTVWEVRTTGNANNGGGFIDRLPGTSVDYSQQNASQLSSNDLACVLPTVVLTSVIGGFTPAMVGNLIQIRAGGVNFTPGFYEIVQWNSVNSVNLDRTPVAGGNGTGGLGETGGALISPETVILQAVNGNIGYIKNGTYTFTATRIVTNPGITLFGYDLSRIIRPTGNNRPLLQLQAFFITTALRFSLENIRFTGSGPMIIEGNGNQLFVFNCKFENTNNAGTRRCIYFDNSPDATCSRNSQIVNTEFSGTAGANSRGFENINGGSPRGLCFLFCFFHDLTYGYSHGSGVDIAFIKCTFARIGQDSITQGSIGSGVVIIFNSFYSAGGYHLFIGVPVGLVVYGNTFDSAVVAAISDNSVPNNIADWINSNDFWNNGASVVGCVLDSGNIGLNPLWVNPPANDFNFGPGSPCIDNALGIRIGV